jgi:deoxyadenosine/deoxycytidine kinase
MFTIIDEFLPKPDLLIYLYLDVSNLQQNIKSRGRSYEQDIKDSYLENIQNGYFNHIKKMNTLKVLVIDTNNIDFVNQPKDYEAILALIDNDYSQGIHRFTL